MGSSISNLEFEEVSSLPHLLWKRLVLIFYHADNCEDFNALLKGGSWIVSIGEIVTDVEISLLENIATQTTFPGC